MSCRKGTFGVRPLIIILFMVSLGLVIGRTPVAHAATLTVTNLNNSGTGSLRWAINQANVVQGPSDIYITAGGTLVLDWPLPFVLHDLVIHVNASQFTIDGNGHQVFTITPGMTLTISSACVNCFKIINGHTESSFGGGAIYNNRGTLSLSYATLSGNSADSQGGAIFNDNGTVDLSNVAIVNNLATTNHGDLVAAGGGIYSLGGSVSLRKSTLSNNAAAAGGAIFMESGSLWIQESTFAGNTAVTSVGGSGGALYLHNSPTEVSHATFSGNGATAAGGALFTNVGWIVLANSIIANSTAGQNCSGGMTDWGGNIRWPSSDATCVGTMEDPRLGPLQHNGSSGSPMTMALLSGSGAIDHALSCSHPSDERGMLRPQGGACDSGAYERGNPAASQVVAGSGQSTRISRPFPVPLQFRVMDEVSGPLDAVSVSFTGPGSGPSIANPNSVQTNSSGVASFSAVANGQIGGPYLVTASAGSSSQLKGYFSLVNVTTSYLPLIRK